MVFIFGLVLGSFYNVVAYRLPNDMSLVYPSSHCPNCNYRLKWYDNIPLFSYIFLGGKCHNCKKHITFRYTLVELANTILWLACAYLFKENLIYAIISMFVCSICIIIFFIDLEHMIIMDRFQLMMLVLAVLVIIFDNTYLWYSHLIGMAVAGLVNYIIVIIMNKILKKDSLGGGDIKFFIISGLLLGWERYILMMLVASITAAIFMLIRMKKHGNKETAFAPFLTSGLIFALFFGEMILEWYFKLF